MNSRFFASLVLLWPLMASAVIENKPIEITGGSLLDPVSISHAGDGSGLLFINEQGGQIRIINPDTGVMEATPFLDLSGSGTNTVLAPTPDQYWSEQGLLGLAFDPAYSSNRRFYVYYTSNGSTTGCPQAPASGDVVVSRFERDALNPLQADPASEQCLLLIRQPSTNHNGGQLAFGPDGMLYIGTGDGGGQGDPNENAQNMNSLLGKILRIDVSGSSYSIPADNPFVGTGSREEIWALGLRNPWRFSFDRQNGDLWIADVGQATWEEINFQPASSTGGENYGWDCREGPAAYLPFNDVNPDCPSLEGKFTEPVISYSHSETGGCSITGGYSYRGPLAYLHNRYFYGDYCSGDIWMALKENGQWLSRKVFNDAPGLTSFGEGENGALYYVQGTSLYRITGDIFEGSFEGSPLN